MCEISNVHTLPSRFSHPARAGRGMFWSHQANVIRLERVAKKKK